MPVRDCLIPTLAASTVFLILAESVEAVPIYSQVLPEEPEEAFTSWITPVSQEVADSFMVDGVGVYAVRCLRLIGGYGVNTPPPFTPPLDALPPDRFQIVFLEDARGIPGSLVSGGKFTITSTFSRTPIGGQLLNGPFNAIEYAVDLDNGIVLDRGAAYWHFHCQCAGTRSAFLRCRRLFDIHCLSLLQLSLKGIVRYCRPGRLQRLVRP